MGSPQNSTLRIQPKEGWRGGAEGSLSRPATPQASPAHHCTVRGSWGGAMPALLPLFPDPGALAAWSSACCPSQVQGPHLGSPLGLSSHSPGVTLPDLPCRTEFPRPPWAQSQGLVVPTRAWEVISQPKVPWIRPRNSLALPAAGA